MASQYGHPETERGAEPGRPRSERSRRAILRAVLSLTREIGYGAVTTRAIAARAGVGRQTLFRWWPSKAAIVLEALLEDARLQIQTPETDSLVEDLGAFLQQTFRALTRTGDVVRSLMAEAQSDPEFAEAFRDRFIARRRDTLRAVFERARARGECALGDDELLLDLAFGPMWYRLMVGHQPLDAAFARRLARTVAAAASGGDGDA